MTPPADLPFVLTLAETLAVLRVSRRSYNEQLRAGTWRLQSVMRGLDRKHRFLRDDVLAFARSRSVHESSVAQRVGPCDLKPSRQER